MKYLLFFFMIIFHSCGEKNSNTYYTFLSSCQSGTKDPKCMVGATLPIFKAETLSGKVISNYSLKGKVTVVNFWFKACPPCIAEIPGFNALVSKYGKSKFNFLAVSKDPDEVLTDFLSKTEWNFDHIKGGKELISNTFRNFWGYPTTFILDQNGVIIEAFSGGAIDSTAPDIIQEKIEPFLL